MTAGSMPEKQRSLTPELESRRLSFGGGMDTEMCKTSSASYLPDNTVEQFTGPSVSPPQASAVDQLNTSSNHAIEPAVVSVHYDHDTVHVTEPSSQHPDTASSQIAVSDATETSHSGKKKKKKKRHSPEFNDNSEDVRQTAVKESRKHKHRHKDHLHAVEQVTAPSVDEPHKLRDVASESSSKDNVDSMPRSDSEVKQKKSADGFTQKAVVDDVVNSENVNDKKNKKRESDENFASKSFGEECRARAVISGKVIRQYRHQDSIRERLSVRTSSSLKNRKKTSVISFLV